MEELFVFSTVRLNLSILSDCHNEIPFLINLVSYQDGNPRYRLFRLSFNCVFSTQQSERERQTLLFGSKNVCRGFPSSFEVDNLVIFKRGKKHTKVSGSIE